MIRLWFVLLRQLHGIWRPAVSIMHHSGHRCIIRTGQLHGRLEQSTRAVLLRLLCILIVGFEDAYLGGRSIAITPLHISDHMSVMSLTRGARADTTPF